MQPTAPGHDAFPDVLRIETVGICNFKCIHCPTGIDPNNRAVLQRDRFTAILDQCRAAGFVPRVVVLYHGGEPLVNRNLAEYVRAVKAMGVAKTAITSNASLLTAQRAEELIAAGLDEIKISFDGESPAENDAIRRNGNFDANAANVLKLLELRRSAGSRLRVVISNVRLCDRATLATMVAGPGKKNPAFDDAPAFLREYFHEYASELEFRSIPAMVWPGYEQFVGVEEFRVGREQPTYCDVLFETFTILSNGDVVLCCYDLRGELVLGNVFESTMFDIWNSPAYAQLRADFRRRVYSSLCAKCTYVSGRYLCRTSSGQWPLALSHV